jgi:hypothetical protein
MFPSPKTLILRSTNHSSNNPNFALMLPSPKTLILTTNYPLNSPQICPIIFITQNPNNHQHPSNNPQIYLRVSFIQHPKFSFMQPNTPKPNQGYKLNLIQIGATMAKTLNMLPNKILGFHHLLGGLGFRINLTPSPKPNLFN